MCHLSSLSRKGRNLKRCNIHNKKRGLPHPLALSPCGRMMALSYYVYEKRRYRYFFSILYLDGKEQDDKKDESEKGEMSVRIPGSNVIYPSTKWRTLLDECLPDLIMSACFSPCCRYLAVLCQSGGLYVWSIATRRRVVKVGEAEMSDKEKGEVDRKKSRGSKRAWWGKPFCHLPASPLPTSSSTSASLSACTSPSSFFSPPPPLPSSSSSGTLLSEEGIPYFTPFTVTNVEIEKGAEEAWTCCFSPRGDTLSLISDRSLHSFHLLEVPPSLTVLTSAGTHGEKRGGVMQKRGVPHLSPCCSCAQPLSAVERRTVLTTLPSFHTGQHTRVFMFPPKWVTFAHAPMHDERKVGECVWTCPILDENSERKGQKAGVGDEEMIISPSSSFPPLPSSSQPPLRRPSHSCGAHLLSSRIDWSGVPYYLEEELGGRMGTMIAWSTSGRVMAICMRKGRGRGGRGVSSRFENAGILLLRAQCGSLRFFQFVEAEAGRGFRVVYDIQFAPNNDRFLFAQLQVDAVRYLYVYRQKKRGGDCSLLPNLLPPYQQVQKVPLDHQAGFDESWTFTSPSLSHLYVLDMENSAMHKFKLDQGEEEEQGNEREPKYAGSISNHLRLACCPSSLSPFLL